MSQLQNMNQLEENTKNLPRNMSDDQIQWHSMKFNEYQQNSIDFNDYQLMSMNIDGDQQILIDIHEDQPILMDIMGNQQKDDWVVQICSLLIKRAVVCLV